MTPKHCTFEWTHNLDGLVYWVSRIAALAQKFRASGPPAARAAELAHLEDLATALAAATNRIDLISPPLFPWILATSALSIRSAAAQLDQAAAELGALSVRAADAELAEAAAEIGGAAAQLELPRARLDGLARRLAAALRASDAAARTEWSRARARALIGPSLDSSEG